MDSALCQKWRRAEFLALVSTKVLLFNREQINVLEPFTGDSDSFTHRRLGLAALNWILKRGVHLASLRLTTYPNVSEHNSIRDAVTSLALNGHLDKLETISLNQCYYIKNAVLAAVLSKCYRSAKSIDIQGCDLTESSAVHIKIAQITCSDTARSHFCRAMSKGVLPLLQVMSISAPASTRSSAIDRWLRLQAHQRAVCPYDVTAFSSTPCRSSTITHSGLFQKAATCRGANP
jgi:hypothetical protein